MSAGPRFVERELAMVPVGLLRADPGNPRSDVGPELELAELGRSMLEHGCLQPLLVEALQGGAYRIVAGHRRRAAAVLVGMAELPCRIRPRAGTGGRRTAAQLVENMHRRALAPMDEARAMRELVALYGSVAAAARAVGRSGPWVRDRLALLDLPADAQALVAAGELRPTAAAAMAKQVRRTGSGSAGLRRPGGGRGRTGAYFGPTHRLADIAQRRCTDARHPRSPRVGTVACGPCWEAAILSEGGAARAG